MRNNLLTQRNTFTLEKRNYNALIYFLKCRFKVRIDVTNWVILHRLQKKTSPSHFFLYSIFYYYFKFMQ